jgi:ABC-type transporter Mla subunit MlaD
MDYNTKKKQELVELCREKDITIDSQKQLADAVDAKDRELIEQEKAFVKTLKDAKAVLRNIHEEKLVEITAKHERAIVKLNETHDKSVIDLTASVAEYKTTLQNAYEHMNRMVFVTKSIIENNDNLLKNLQGSLDNAIQLSSYAAEEFRNLIPAPPKQQK